MAKDGRAVKLAAGIYAVGTSLSPNKTASQHLHEIVAHIWPGAVISGASALAGGLAVGGHLFLTHPDPKRTADLRLPGVTVSVTAGPGALPGDMAMPYGLAVSGPARLLVENVGSGGRTPAHGPRRASGLRAVEDRIDEDARVGGSGRIRGQLAQLDAIASFFSARPVAVVRSRLAAVAGTFTAGRLGVVSGRLEARLSRRPYDARRIEMFRVLAAGLVDRAPQPVPALGTAERWAWLPFFESYFSNFIEGTEFGVEEARKIAIDGVVPPDRPQDAHDVSATYQVATHPRWSTFAAASGEELVAAVRSVHATLMAARPEKHPGQFKTRANFAGGYAFVEPELVEGTLLAGFGCFSGVTDPFQRACALMFLITECHPFGDGNGRTARLVANGTLSAAGQVRIIVPTIYRGNYLAGLTAVSVDARHGEAFVDVLGFAQRWTAAVDWTDFDNSQAQLRETHAFLDAATADSTGLRLRLPRQ